MKHQEFTWNASDGIKIYGQCWTPDTNPQSIKAVICLVHGMGELSARYSHVAAYYTQYGYAVITYDQRGHGKSGGSRGHSPSFDLLLDGVAELFIETDKLFPGLPKFLYGHSMGGNVVLNYSLRRNPKVAGVIATSPWLKLAFEPPAIKVWLGKMMNNIFPGFTQSSEIDASAISRDKTVVDAYINNALVHDKISAAMFVGIHDNGLWALEHASEMKLPLLLCHGTKDRLTSAEASKEFAGKVEGDVTLKLWQGLYHETHNEPEKQEVFAFMKDWMDKHL